MSELFPLHQLNPARFETAPILKKLALASRQLAELKGIAASMPHQGILINSLGIREAKDSSAIENIVTTNDELFQEDVFPELAGSAAAKEVPGTALKNAAGETVYVPPHDATTVLRLMGELERFINGANAFGVDPLIKMALIHYQFESIHPFYDGNGRTGRIVNVLYLVKEGLLDIPILYLSRYIMSTKSDYYRLLQAVREQDAWEEWVLYLLTAVEQTASGVMKTITAMRDLLLETKHRIRAEYKFYSQDLINNLFSHPYTRIEFVQRDLNVSRLTASRYLEALTAGGVLRKQKVGRSNYYINAGLYTLLTAEEESNV